jgi:hypothetical protein
MVAGSKLLLLLFMTVERMTCSDTVTPRHEDAMKYLAKAIPILFPNINLLPTMPNEIKNIIHSLKSKNVVVMKY